MTSSQGQNNLAKNHLTNNKQGTREISCAFSYTYMKLRIGPQVHRIIISVSYTTK